MQELFYRMVSQNTWIGITIAALVVGIVVGYAAFLGMQTSQRFGWNPQMMMNSNMMTQNPQVMNQWNQQMMGSQAGRQQMMSSMMQNPQFMSEMMNDQQFQNQIIQQMKQNHEFMQSMVTSMMNDPQIRAQMIGHISENREFMQEMQQALGDQTATTGLNSTNSTKTAQ